VKRIAVLLVTAALFCAAATIFRPVVERAWFVYSLATDTAPAHLPNPVRAALGHKLVDSWDAPRSGGRHHQGIDIFAPRDTPVVSTTRGLVTRVGTNRLGGQIVTVLGPGLESHYYAHLDRFGAFHAGDIVNPGDVLGYVGNTGNARGTPTHLHYGIYGRRGAENPFLRLTPPRNARVTAD
jgi:murein DD-endopeptidase MepM/ murein hydrolase activator NlpD